MKVLTEWLQQSISLVFSFDSMFSIRQKCLIVIPLKLDACKTGVSVTSDLVEGEKKNKGALQTRVKFNCECIHVCAIPSYGGGKQVRRVRDLLPEGVHAP